MKVFKWIFNIIRGLIIIYLITLAFLFVMFYVKKNTYHEKYPSINGYSYYKIDNATLEPEIRKDNYLILKKSEDIEVGDFVAYLDGPEQDIVIRKVVERDNYKLTLDVTNNYENKEYRTVKEIDDISAKVVYNNNTVSSIANVLLNPIMIVILLFLGTIFPEFIFNK